MPPKKRGKKSKSVLPAEDHCEEEYFGEPENEFPDEAFPDEQDVKCNKSEKNMQKNNEK